MLFRFGCTCKFSALVEHRSLQRSFVGKEIVEPIYVEQIRHNHHTTRLKKIWKKSKKHLEQSANIVATTKRQHNVTLLLFEGSQPSKWTYQLIKEKARSEISAIGSVLLDGEATHHRPSKRLGCFFTCFSGLRGKKQTNLFFKGSSASQIPN